MPSLVLRSLIPFLLVASFLSLKVEFCVCADGNDQYANCSRTITCGDINISYPFWGKNRPSYCGQPGYELNCIDNVTFINMSRTMFRILEVNYSAPLVRVARQDYWGSIYPQSYVNTTVNSSLFRLTSKITNISFYYGCNISTSVHVSVPVLTTAAMDYEDNRTTIEDAVNRGFELELKIDNKDQCNQCKQSGGTCGRNTSNGGFSCFCRDQSQPSSICKTRPIPPPGKLRQLVIGISGAAAGTLGIIVCIIGIKRKSLSAFFKNKKREDEFRVEEFIRNYGSFTPKRYSYSHVKKITNSFKDQIGKGGYGTVYKGRLPDGLVVAVKVLSETKGNGEDFMNEVASIGRTSHVNIVTLRGFCYDRNKAALIYEFMPNGSLDSFIHNHGSEMGNSRLGWSTLSEIAVGIAKGLEYLHNGCNTRILHFDIKPQNILLDKDFCPKISDFGLSKLCKTKASIVSMQGTRGTVGYIAPEVFSRNFGGVSHKSDVYSYGMLVLEMVGARKNLDSGVSHTSDMFPHYVYKDLELDENENMFGAISEEEKIIARKMILVSLWCIQTNPSDRPSMSKVVEMLEGPLNSLQIAPKPLLFSSATAVVSTVPEDSTLGSQQHETS